VGEQISSWVAAVSKLPIFNRTKNAGLETGATLITYIAAEGHFIGGFIFF
jgi:hypothetical protein